MKATQKNLANFDLDVIDLRINNHKASFSKSGVKIKRMKLKEKYSFNH